MTVDRLSALDECFLRLENSAAHMHIGWTLVVDGDPPPIESLRVHIAGRLELLPRFRQRVISPLLRLHDPVWADDTQFDLANHVVTATVPAPGGPAALRELAGELLSVPLSRDRPLWRLYLIDGLGDGRFAIVGQAHHALVDGIAAVEISQLLLDMRPTPLRPVPAPWSPAPEPSIVQRTLASAAERARLGRAAGSLAVRALVHPSSVGDGIAELRRLGSALSPVGNPAPSTLLNHPIGPQRSVAFAELSLDAAREMGRRHDATVNDVFLAATSLGLGRYLRRAGESHPWLRVLVPVNTRVRDDGRELGNQISLSFVDLPIGERDPLAALEEVRRQTIERKRADLAGALDGLVRAGAVVPVQVRDIIAWLLTRPQTFNSIVSNVPGPREPLYLLGQRVHAAYPTVPLMRGQAVSIGVLSYCGALHLGLYADPAIVPDVIELARDLSSSFDAMRLTLTPPPPTSAPTPSVEPLEPVEPATPSGQPWGQGALV